MADCVGTAMRITKTQNRGMQKGRLPFLAKIVYMNALVEVAKVIRMHGLYPVPRHDIAKQSPQINIAHKYLMKRERDDVAVKFKKLQSAMQDKEIKTFSAAVKRSVLGARHLNGNVYDLTTLTLFILSYINWLNKTHLAITRTQPIFTIGIGTGLVWNPPPQLENMVLRTKPNDDGTELYVKNMKELFITDNVGPRSLSTHDINIYVVQNGHLKKTEEFERKLKCIKANTSNTTSPIMSINTNKVAATQPPKKEKINEGEGNQARKHAPSTNKHPTTYQRYINAQTNPSTTESDHKSISQTSNDHAPRSSA